MAHYKIHNPYRSHILGLNMMDISSPRNGKTYFAEFALILFPAFIAFTAIGLSYLPELSFIAECQNVAGGDICTISFR